MCVLTVRGPAGVTVCAVDRVGGGRRGHAGAPDEAERRQPPRGQAGRAEARGTQPRLARLGEQGPGGLSLGLGLGLGWSLGRWGPVLGLCRGEERRSP